MVEEYNLLEINRLLPSCRFLVWQILNPQMETMCSSATSTYNELHGVIPEYITPIITICFNNIDEGWDRTQEFSNTGAWHND
jgi:hypothetical protein